MKSLDAIGIQINIKDDWPVDKEARKKLRQCSDYVEIINDLNECKRILDVSEKLTADSSHEFNFMNGIQLQPLPPGVIARSLDSAFNSRYGRCFNSGASRTVFDESQCLKILGDTHHSFH